ncbi:TPA: hypothetical protein ACGOA2_002209, partial [Streptococcus agalactiae]
YLQSEFLKCKNPDGEAGSGNAHQKQPCGTFQQKTTKEKPQRLCDLHGYGKYKFCCMEIVLPLSR